MFSCLRNEYDVEQVEIVRDTKGGKNLISVKINGELVFSYDSNFEGDYYIGNGIQMPFSKDDIDNSIITTPMPLPKRCEDEL